jgi:hypothetical protein
MDFILSSRIHVHTVGLKRDVYIWSTTFFIIWR